MSRKIILVILVTTLSLAVGALSASAVGPYYAIEDGYLWLINNGTDPDHFTGTANNLLTGTDTSDCAPDRMALMKWDLSGVDDTKTIAKVVVTFTGNTNNFTGNNIELSLFSTTDGWTESSSSPPSIPIPGDSGSTNLITNIYNVDPDVVQFEAVGTNHPLVKFVQGEVLHDNTVSLWMKITGGNCSQGTVTLVNSVSHEGGRAPTMAIYSTNGVLLSDLRGETESLGDSPWGVLAMLMLALAAVGAGVSFLLRGWVHSQ